MIDLLFGWRNWFGRHSSAIWNIIHSAMFDYGKREYKQINWSTLLFDWSQSIQNHFFFVYNFFVILLRYIVLIIMMSMT